MIWGEMVDDMVDRFFIKIIISLSLCDLFQICFLSFLIFSPTLPQTLEDENNNTEDEIRSSNTSQEEEDEDEEVLFYDFIISFYLSQPQNHQFLISFSLIFKSK